MTERRRCRQRTHLPRQETQDAGVIKLQSQQLPSPPPLQDAPWGDSVGRKQGARPRIRLWATVLWQVGSHDLGKPSALTGTSGTCALGINTLTAKIQAVS